MTATLETPRLPVEDLGRQARTAPSPGRVIATVFAGLFFALGFAIGGTWRGLAFCAVSARFGYWKGLGWSDEQIARVIAAKAAARQPAQPAGPRMTGTGTIVWWFAGYDGFGRAVWIRTGG